MQAILHRAIKQATKPLSDVVKEYIKDTYNKPGKVYLGVVHRLDRPTSGAIIFARTSKSLERLNKMLRDKNHSQNLLGNCKKSSKERKRNLN